METGHEHLALEALSAPRRSAPAVRLRSLSILGVRVTDTTKHEAMLLMDTWIRARDGRARAVFIVNAHTLNLACDDPAYRAVLNAAEVVFADGTGVRLAASLQGTQLMDNLVGTDLLPLFFKTRLRRAYRYFLLGGTPGTAARAVARLQSEFPGIRMIGHHHGYFRESETASVISMINAAAPDMLLVAMGNPHQERWIHNHLRMLRVPLSIGVGGLIDHWAGNLQRAPQWVRRLGMEWGQILVQQPHKWRRYLLGNPKFVVRAVIDARRGGIQGGLQPDSIRPLHPRALTAHRTAVEPPGRPYNRGAY